MTTIDKIRAEIERRIVKYRAYGFECHAISLEYFRKEFLDTLQEPEPSLPSDLDEAALNHLHKKYEHSVIIDDEDRAIVDDFKAGAEWMEARFEHCGTFPLEDQRGGYWPTDYYIKKK